MTNIEYQLYTFSARLFQLENRAEDDLAEIRKLNEKLKDVIVQVRKDAVQDLRGSMVGKLPTVEEFLEGRDK